MMFICLDVLKLYLVSKPFIEGASVEKQNILYSY